MSSDVLYEDELSLLDIIQFFKRQKFLMLKVFLILFSFCLVFAFSRPTLYLNEVDLLIGKNYYNSNSNSNSNEVIEQIKFIYGKDVDIENVRNTNIIRVKATDLSAELAEKKAKNVVESIVDEEAKQIDLKKTEFESLLKVVGDNVLNKKQTLDLLGEAANTNKTKVLSNETTKLVFGGKWKQALGIGFFISLLLALLLAVLRDQYSKLITKI